MRVWIERRDYEARKNVNITPPTDSRTFYLSLPTNHLPNTFPKLKLQLDKAKRTLHTPNAGILELACMLAFKKENLSPFEETREK